MSAHHWILYRWENKTVMESPEGTRISLRDLFNHATRVSTRPPRVECADEAPVEVVEQTGVYFTSAGLVKQANDQLIPDPWVDPWPMLPMRTGRQVIDDKAQVIALIYNMNRDIIIDQSQGIDGKLLGYSTIDPVRISVAKKSNLS